MRLAFKMLFGFIGLIILLFLIFYLFAYVSMLVYFYNFLTAAD